MIIHKMSPQTAKFMADLNDGIAGFRDIAATELSCYNRNLETCEGTRNLTEWYVIPRVHDDGCYYVDHYVGGEDYDTTFDGYTTAREAEFVARYLNKLTVPLTYNYMRALEL
jgi:hypothetical protein